jgi:uncharacterized hydrophobic protein (TIGR00271 family)
MRNMLGAILRAARFDPQYQEAFDAKLFFDGTDWVRRLVNFVMLLALATLIATFGVIADSTVVIIGAMLIAPLMTPIMATAAALVIGQGIRAAQSLVLVAGGVVLVIGLATLVTLFLPHEWISFTTNNSITSRITPGLLDLLVALASGAAGAYITMRPEIADAFGGVAIAISLVPPLCVVGISLATTHWPAAIGALLLFVTNFLSILLAGSIVFRLADVGVRGAMSATVRRRAFVVIVVATGLIAIPLAALTYRTLLSARESAEVTASTQAWLGTRPYDITAVEIDETAARITLSGEGGLPPVSQLATHIASQLGHPVKVIVYVVPRKTLEVGDV